MSQHRYFQYGVFIVLCLTVQTAVSDERVVKQVFFPYVLVEEHGAVAGRIQHDGYRGQRVVAIEEGEGHGHGKEKTEEHFLKIVKRLNNESKTTKMFDVTMTGSGQKPTPTAHRHTQANPTMTSNSDMTSDPVNPRAAADDLTTSEKDHVSAHFNIPKSTGQSEVARRMLLPDIGPHIDHTIHIIHKRNIDTDNQPVVMATNVVTTAFVVMDTTAFSVDAEGFIVVEDVTEIEEKDLIEFFVLLEDTSNGKAISNPLPFIVYVERPVSSGYPAVPAVFAGVLVLIVVFFAFLIPFVTRAKRRAKQGKPIFKLGSHGSSVDLARSETFTDISRSDSEPNWNGPNSYYNYAVEVEHEKSHFGRDLKDFAREHPPKLQLTKKTKYSSDGSSSSGIDVASGAEGTIADENLSQRL